MRLYSDSGDLAGATNVAQETLRIFAGDEPARQFIDHPPIQNVGYWVNVSLRQHRAGRYPESIAAAREALKRKPDYAEAYNNIAAVYEAMGSGTTRLPPPTKRSGSSPISSWRGIISRGPGDRNS